MERRTISSGTVWEPKVGYSRAVRVGPWVIVSGTAAADRDGRVVSPGDAYAQTVFILRKIQASLEQAGSRLEDVVRTRIFVTNLKDFEAVGRAHAEFFHDIRPASTLVQVRGLLDPDMVVEMEADAVVAEGS